MKQFLSQARAHDGVPQSIICAAFPAIREFILDNLRPFFRSDFKPIAILCFLSKVLERLFHNQITDYLEIRQLFDRYQSGYRKGHSTQSTLIKLPEDIRAGMDRKHVTMLFLFDFSKAFDTVCNITLLRKLRAAGFSHSALKWITSYLTDKKQTVIDDNETLSTYARLNREVPQGSGLEPLLFLCS